ncbi:MAG: hypothetical protein ACYCYO_00245 [Bacilli bacterium]
MNRLKRVWADDRAFMEPLFFSFLIVTLAAIFLPILLWVAGALLGYEALQNAADSAAFAGQSQVSQATGTGSLGYFGGTGVHVESTSATQASTTILNAEMQSLRLPGGFTNLSGDVGVIGSDVSVTVSGVYEPVLLAPLFTVFPQFSQVVSIPMQVTATEQFYTGG